MYIFLRVLSVDFDIIPLIEPYYFCFKRLNGGNQVVCVDGILVILLS